MFKELIPRNNPKDGPYITYSPKGYLTFNSPASNKLNQVYGFPDRMNVLIDEDNKIIRFVFCPEGKYKLTLSCGRNYQMSFSYGKRLGVKVGRYKDITWNKNHLDVRYET